MWVTHVVLCTGGYNHDIAWPDAFLGSKISHACMRSTKVCPYSLAVDDGVCASRVEGQVLVDGMNFLDASQYRDSRKRPWIRTSPISPPTGMVMMTSWWDGKP